MIKNNFYSLASLVVITLFVISSCVPPNNEIKTDIDISYNDISYQQLYDFQDEQNVDSLLLFFKHPNPTFRFIAVNSMASIQSELAIDSLISSLADPSIDVRIAAAYALGQIGSPTSVNALTKAFIKRDTIDVDNRFNSTILEAIGKSGPTSLLDAIVSVENYRATDTLLLLGQARAVYRFANRGITSQKGTDRMIEVSTNNEYPEQVRVLAAHYLARAKDIDISKGQFRLAEVLSTSSSPNLRMAVSLALNKVSDPSILKSLQTQLFNEEDYRVKINILKALGNFNYIDNIDLIIDHLSNENIHVANTAAQFLIDHGNRTDAEIYKTFATDKIDHSVRAKIYASVLKHLPAYYTNSKGTIRKLILNKIQELKDRPYVAKHYVLALGFDEYNYSILNETAIDSGHLVLQTAGMEALSNIASSERFAKTFKSKTNSVKLEILDIIKTQFAKGDVGVMAVGAGILSNEKIGYRDLIKNDSFLISAAEKLSLPKEIETYNEIKKALAYINNVKYEAEKPSYNHPIDWTILSTVSDSTIAVVKTDKGNFTIQLYSETAPGSVANFIKLANDDFFDDKVNHRVVPNFVIQTGCPRGDGYGSLDYTIRSELSQRYYDDEGYVGMASAGLNTESTQWFVTHSPTPHLDGRYTIFGKIINGMDVVHEIVEGDKINDVIITQRR